MYATNYFNSFITVADDCPVSVAIVPPQKTNKTATNIVYEMIKKLTKRYGWGIHFDAEGKVALYAVESEEYNHLSQNKNLKMLKAMRSKKG